jgi:hypothetical protein
MTESPHSNSDFGPLLWPRFYGPSVEYRKSYYERYANLVVAAAATLLFLSTGLMLFLGGGDARMGALNITIAICIPLFMWHLQRKARTSMDYKAMERRGSFDWDLYGNGILARNYSEEGPGHVREAFHAFADFSGVYFKVDEGNARTVWELVKAAAKHAREKDGGDYDEAEFLWDDSTKAMVKGYIWFIDRVRVGASFELDRDQVYDLGRLESILRDRLKFID